MDSGARIGNGDSAADSASTDPWYSIDPDIASVDANSYSGGSGSDSCSGTGVGRSLLLGQRRNGVRRSERARCDGRRQVRSSYGNSSTSLGAKRAGWVQSETVLVDTYREEQLWRSSRNAVLAGACADGGATFVADCAAWFALVTPWATDRASDNDRFSFSWLASNGADDIYGDLRSADS
jgi:hypothetical protein